MSPETPYQDSTWIPKLIYPAEKKPSTTVAKGAVKRNSLLK